MPFNTISLPNDENLSLVHSGADYFSRLEKMIQDSQSEIHIQIYIFDCDTIGSKIIEALKEAASRKVKIYILLDGFGSYSFPSEIIADLKQRGINFRFFSPLFSKSSFYLGRRLHHKVIVVDAKVALIGGINIADKYYGTKSELPWLDYAVLIHGEIAKPLQELCYAIYFKKRKLQKSKIGFPIFKQEKNAVTLLQNDWLKRKNEITKAYIKGFKYAQKDIIIVGSYFLPGRKLINALKIASQNKVRIRLILSGISDLPLTRRATCHLYSKLLNNSIELYEWDNSILHGKAAVIDNHWTTIGSFNLNNLSSYGSIEMNVGINSIAFSELYLLHLNQIISECQRITHESLKTKNTISSKFINWLSYWITRAIEIMITYLPYNRFQ